MSAFEPVTARVAALDRMLRSHGGGLELLSCDAAGRVRVRFTGMCVGCELRPVTAHTVVEPLLAELEGVRAVDVAGGRVSEYALAALQAGGCRAAGTREAVLRFEARPAEPA